MRRLFLAVERGECRSVDQVDVQPAVIVIVDEAQAGTVGVDDEPLVGCAITFFQPERPAAFVASSKTIEPESTKPLSVMERLLGSRFSAGPFGE